MRYLLLALLLAGLFIFCKLVILPIDESLRGIPNLEDANQSASLYRYVVSHIQFDGQSATDTNHSPVYCSPITRNSPRLDVYGFTNSDRQELVLSVVREWQATNRNVMNLDVRFYKQENWKTFTNNDGSITGGRLPELLLNETHVIATNNPELAHPAL